MSGPAEAHAIIGHERVIARLRAAMDAQSLHHAYLFEGPRGVGKATVAAHLAQAANCTAQTGPTPCRTCPSCKQIEAGTHPDVMRLEPRKDRASKTIAIEDVREIIRRTGYHRYGSQRRFVIVDPAEAMQPSAANALLKTLEEPPLGTGFILIAANASALLPTILSRCQRVRFGAVPLDLIEPWLAERGHGENASQAALSAQGCPGRALELADGRLAKRNQLRSEMLNALAGDPQSRFDWAAALTKGPRAVWRSRVDTVLELLEDLLRDASVHGSGADLPLLNADAEDTVAEWSEALWPDGVRRLHDAITQTRDGLAVMVGGKLVLDALMAQVWRELRG